MIDNHDFLFVSNRDHNSPTLLIRQLNKMACNLLEVLTKFQLLQSVYIFRAYLFILIIYCKICASSVDNIIFITILAQAAEVK